MRPCSKLKRGPGRLLRAFKRDRDGATAVEFAVVGAIFLPFMLGMMETALIFWAAQDLDTSLNNATRGLYTGTFQSSNGDASTPAKTQQALTNLRNLMCYPNGDTKAAKTVTVFDCNAVKIDVLTSQQFKDASAGDASDANFGTRYTPPKSGEIAIVQAAVKYPVIFGLNPFDGAKPGGTRLLRATVAFRTEPY